MLDLWIGLTDAQASLLSTALVIVAGGLGVLLSALLFGGRVKDLETALKKSEEEMNRALAQSGVRIDQFNAQLSEKLGTVDEQFSATLDALGQIRQSVASLQDAANEKVLTLRDQLRAHWLVIASRIEEIASDSKIHGKRRARYSKISRRTMDPLVAALIEDGNLPADKVRLVQGSNCSVELLQKWESYVAAK